MSASSVTRDVKRPRENNDEHDVLTAPPSFSSYAALIEITHGITQSAAEVYEKKCLGFATAYQDLDKLLSSTLFRQKTFRFLSLRPDGLKHMGPVEIGVIQLVANDCKMLVFTSDAIAPLNVSATVGQRVCIGDMVLFQRFRSEKEEEDNHATPALEFLLLDPSALLDASDWCHAASWNVMTTARWLQKLLSCPSGLAQMTCIVDSFLGNVETSVTATATAADAWLRSLQLPVLLKQLKEVNGVDTRKVYQVQKFVFSVLRLYIAILGSAESIMSVPCVVEDVVYQLVASPLFVDVLSVVLPQLADSVSESTWMSAQQTMLDAMSLAMRYVCRELVGWEGKWRREARQNAEYGFFTVLHRISGMWLTRETKASQTSTQGIIKLIEEMARTGVFRRATQWVRYRERVTNTVSLVDNAHQPPTLQDIKDLHGLKETSVKEMMAAMTQTYTPYLRHESLRFVECAMLAAYAELYGPVARAISSFIETFATMRLDDMVEQPKEMPLRVVRVSQTALRCQFSEYSLEEVQLHALFGLPLSITLRTTDKMAILGLLHGTTSSFGYVVVILNDKIFIFPVVVCNVIDDKANDSVVTITIYAVRDRDILLSMVAASAVEYGERGGLSEAWLFCNAHQLDRNTEKNDYYSHRDDHYYYRLGGFSPQLMPQGTSAVSYMLFILHLQKLRARLRQEEQGGVGRVKGVQGRSDTIQGGVLWWGNDISNSSSSRNTNSTASMRGSGIAGDLFVCSSPLTGENEALQKCVTELTKAASFTPSQVECLHMLTSVGSGVRTLVGAVGSGKTTLIHTSSLSRGRAQEALRKQHQLLWHSMIKRSAQTLSMRLGELAAAEDMEDLFTVVDKSSARDITEEVTNAALGHIQEHVHLSENLRQCQAPMLLRPRGLKQTPPLHTSRVLQDDKVMEYYHSLESVMIKSHQRTLNAPLVVVLNLQLQLLRRLGDLICVIYRSLEEDVTIDEGIWRLYIELLPWIMSRKERFDTLTEAVRLKKTWVAYLSEDLWDATTIVEGSDTFGITEETVWNGMEPAASSFHAVTLPNSSRGLCQYGQLEAAGWRAVFGEKQRELLCFLQQEILDEAQHLFALFLDVVQSVAATSQTSKVTVVTATGGSLLRELSFLRVWQPRYLLIDDYDQLCDALYLTLSPATSVTISHQAESPPQHEQHLSLVVLKVLQKELQATSFSSTVMLTESLRFCSPEFHKVVQLCRNSSVAFHAPLALGTVGTNDSSIGNGSDGQGRNQQGELPGFSSPCSVELWTHAVALSAGLACDGLAAAFIRNRLQRFDPSIVVRIYCGFLEDKAMIVEGMLLEADNSLTDDTGMSVCTLPFYSEAFMESDEECDVAVLCLSGIARRLQRVSAMEREQEWEKLLAEGSFMGHMEWWLWRTMSYARRGAVLVGSKEVFCFLAPLQRVERFVLQVREQRGYWLPPETKGAVLALRCPEHGNCRQLAMLTYADYRGCQVRVIGVQNCRSLCLASYENCTNPSHACLRICHASCIKGDDSAAKDMVVSPHGHCPFPCAKVQPCGHMCVRSCGETCSPCEFVGLRELSCGQRVVSGMSDTGPVMTLVHHFQRFRCGETPQPCEERVTLRCSRCGSKNPMLCHDVVARGGMESATLTELECAGCVALYNRVAREFVAMEIVPSVPPVAGKFPRETLPEAAQAKLCSLQSIAVKKAQLMLQKEALEMIQGRPTSEFYQQQEVYSRMKKQQEEEAQAHRRRVQESIGLWAKTLKQKYEVQIAANEEIDTEVPLMVSEAIAEEERQQSYLFV